MDTDLLDNAVLTLVIGIISVGIITYSTFYFYPLLTHRDIMIENIGTVVKDIVSITIRQDEDSIYTWKYMVNVIKELSDDNSDISVDQFITEVETILLYHRSIDDPYRPKALRLHRDIQRHLKRSITSEPSLATITIPKRYIVRWISKSLKHRVGS